MENNYTNSANKDNHK